MLHSYITWVTIFSGFYDSFFNIFQPTPAIEPHIFWVFLAANTVLINTNSCIGLLLLQKCCKKDSYKISVVCNNKHLFSSHVCGLAGDVLIQAGGSSAGWLWAMSHIFLLEPVGWSGNVQQAARAQDPPCKSISTSVESCLLISH